MASWKAHLTHDRLDIICLQETHVSSLAQATTLTTTWTRMWGLTSTPTPSHTGRSRKTAPTESPSSSTRSPAWHSRRIEQAPSPAATSKSASLTVASVYAPSTSTRDRQEFFRRLTSLTPPATPLLVGGDFNCVSHPRWDRHLTNPARPLGSECDAMELCLTRLQLCDGIWHTRRTPRTTEDARSFLQHSATCIRPQSNSTSRIDHINVSASLTASVKSVTTHTPGQLSDHNAVCLHIGTTLTHGADRVRLYPIRSTHPQTLTNQILAHIARHAPAHAPPAFIGVVWDKFITGLQDALGHLQAAEHPPKPPISRLDDPVVRITVIEAAAHHLTDLSEYQHGRALRFGDTPSRRFFQRFRSLPDISPPTGYPPTTSADNMANGWRDIMSSSYTSPTDGHALTTTTHSDLLNTVANRLAHAHLDHLMAPVSERELSAALARMECSKAPGPDGIPNGFFPEFHVALTPCLLALFNGLLLGHPLPRSFNEARHTIQPGYMTSLSSGAGPADGTWVCKWASDNSPTQTGHTATNQRSSASESPVPRRPPYLPAHAYCRRSYNQNSLFWPRIFLPQTRGFENSSYLYIDSGGGEPPSLDPVTSRRIFPEPYSSGHVETMDGPCPTSATWRANRHCAVSFTMAPNQDTGPGALP
ncbi:hypothetical protein B5M09_012191 [Aphanomyces astaci]|uniref:Endonuclease/exonuclease/phosphatase domain-containing protein n=1 Tax=Aphanomyces astaci TaxID=112090 RepID=A0A3R7WL61_APHAT|nr:hypothetical protein B5M09_012191 [Aphanomyces astaci]